MRAIAVTTQHQDGSREPLLDARDDVLAPAEQFQAIASPTDRLADPAVPEAPPQQHMPSPTTAGSAVEVSSSRSVFGRLGNWALRAVAGAASALTESMLRWAACTSGFDATVFESIDFDMDQALSVRTRRAPPLPSVRTGDIHETRDGDAKFEVGYARATGLNCYLHTISQLGAESRDTEFGVDEIANLRSEWTERGLVPAKGMIAAGDDGPQEGTKERGLLVKIYCVDKHGKLNHIGNVGEGREVHAVLDMVAEHYSPLWPVAEAGETAIEADVTPAHATTAGDDVAEAQPARTTRRSKPSKNEGAFPQDA